MKIAILLLVIMACTTKIVYVVPPEVEAFIPANSVAYDSVPNIYNQWWEEIADCAHIRGKSMADVRWFSTPPTSEFTSFYCYITYCWGYWRGNHEIYIVAGRELDSTLIKHEMLHELLGTKNALSKDFMKHHKLFKKCKV